MADANSIKNARARGRTAICPKCKEEVHKREVRLFKNLRRGLDTGICDICEAKALGLPVPAKAVKEKAEEKAEAKHAAPKKKGEK